MLVVNERMMGKYVHKYMTCGDCGGTTQKGYVEILEFTYFVRLFTFYLYHIYSFLLQHVQGSFELHHVIHYYNFQTLPLLL